LCDRNFGTISKSRQTGGARRRNSIRMTSVTLKLPRPFDRLAATVDTIPQDVFRAFSKPDVNDGLLDVERWTEMLRDVGFGSSPKTADEFVRSFIADRMMRRG
jgi:hypothetical protein